MSLGALPAQGGEMTLWRAPTENDSLATRGSYELADPAETMGLGVDGPSSAERWREAGLDRLQHRLVDVDRGARRPHHPVPPGGGELGPERDRRPAVALAGR